MAEPIQVDGTEEMKRNFQKIKDIHRGKLMRAVMRKAAAPVRTAARNGLRTRDRTGELKRNIRIMTGAADRFKPFALIGTKDRRPSRFVFYGRFFEFGTAFIPAMPWLRPALTRSKGKVIERFAKALKKEIEKRLPR